MKTIKDFKQVLYNNNKNTLLGLHLAGLINPLGKSVEELREKDQSIHFLEEKVEVIVQMYNNGINVFYDAYRLGSVDKAYYQVMARKYADFR